MLADGTISGGMIPKIQACLRALETVPRVHVLDGRVPHALIRELFTREGVGTMLASETQQEGADRSMTTTTASAPGPVPTGLPSSKRRSSPTVARRWSSSAARAAACGTSRAASTWT